MAEVTTEMVIGREGGHADVSYRRAHRVVFSKKKITPFTTQRAIFYGDGVMRPCHTMPYHAIL